MQQTIEQQLTDYIDRRQSPGSRGDGAERRQFVDARKDSRPEVVEMAEAIDRYKLLHRRRFITFDELYDVITGLGYHK